MLPERTLEEGSPIFASNPTQRIHITFEASNMALGIDGQLKRLQMRKPRLVQCMLNIRGQVSVQAIMVTCGLLKFVHFRRQVSGLSIIYIGKVTASCAFDFENF